MTYAYYALGVAERSDWAGVMRYPRNPTSVADGRERHPRRAGGVDSLASELPTPTRSYEVGSGAAVTG